MAQPEVEYPLGYSSCGRELASFATGTFADLAGVRRHRPVTVLDVRRSHPGDPIITFRPSFACHCPRALKVLVAATAVGLLTGFFGVGGGFLVVPALVLGLGLPMSYAAGTSLVVITITSASALAVRAGAGAHPSWGLLALLTAVAVASGWAGARLTAQADTRRLHAAFTILLLLVAGYTAWQALPALA